MTDFLASMPGAIIILVLGFVLLIKGADYFVDGASAVANKLHVPALIIGMTIVAMGTSLPETAVSVTASINNANSLAISNAVGSNIFNLMVVLGVCACIAKIPVSDDTIKRDLPFSVVCAIVTLVMGAIEMKLGRLDGNILLVMFAVFLIVMVRSAKAAAARGEEVEIEGLEDGQIKDMSTLKCVLCIILGGAAIALGGDWVVDGATTVAIKLGMSETLVGLTIVALGTSLPELVTSFAAARKNEIDMAVGNVVGSNVFNLLMVVGIACTISPIEFLTINIIDIIILVVFSIIVWLMCFKKKHIGRIDGVIMLVLYFAYIAYTIIRE